MNQFVIAINEPKFRLASVYNVRWIASFRIAVDKLKNNYKALVKHLKFVLDNIKDFIKNKPAAFRKKVESIRDFLTNKFAMSLLFFNYDVIDLFSQESLHTQKKGATLIGMGKRKEMLLANLEKVRQLNGDQFKKYLSECSCFRFVRMANQFINNERPAKPCSSLAEYESSPFIVYKTIILKNTQLTESDGRTLQFDKISTFVESYIDDLVDEINNYLPDDELLKFDALDHSLWHLEDPQWRIPSVREVAVLFGLDADLIQAQFTKFLDDLRMDLTWWSRNKAGENSSPEYFWPAVLNNRILDTEFANLIRQVLVVPMGRYLYTVQSWPKRMKQL